MGAQAANPFSNITKAKKLPIYNAKTGETDARLVADFLDLENKDIAKVSNISENSVRFEAARMPEKMKERIIEISNICELVAEHFSGDPERTSLWFKSKNPMLGGITPRDMIRFGRYQKLLQIIMDFKNGNIA